MDLDECEIDEQTGHLICPKDEAMDFKELECTSENELESDGVTTTSDRSEPSKDLEVV